MTPGDTSKSDLSVTSQDYADCRVVTVKGRVDHTNSDDFLSQLTGLSEGVNSSGGMVIDLAGLEFITSAGLRALLLSQRSVSGAGGKLGIAGIGGVVKEVFRISKFDALLSVSDTTAQAVAKVSPGAAEAYPG